jgi:two-component system OmpR family response regulator
MDKPLWRDRQHARRIPSNYSTAAGPCFGGGLEIGERYMANVLVCDDDVDTLKLATMILARAGHKVTPVERGLDALAEVAKNRPDVILLDIMLPDLDGFSVAQKLRTTIPNSPPILFFSARSAPEDQVIGRTLGDGYLLKPVRLTTLLESVQRVLDAKKPTE